MVFKHIFTLEKLMKQICIQLGYNDHIFKIIFWCKFSPKCEKKNRVVTLIKGFFENFHQKIKVLDWVHQIESVCSCKSPNNSTITKTNKKKIVLFVQQQNLIKSPYGWLLMWLHHKSEIKIFIQRCHHIYIYIYIYIQFKNI